VRHLLPKWRRLLTQFHAILLVGSRLFFGFDRLCHRRHRVETYRDVTSVPTFFARMLGKLLDACIWLDDDLMTTHFKLAEHAQLIIFRPVAWKKVGTW
jgi:hypothetical protein